MLVNLILNACDAMPSGGEVRFTGSLVSPREFQLEVRDTGPGVPPDLAGRIFQPFFTTKPAGQGTGLGLAVSRAAAREMQGDLDLEPGPGPGACFRLRLRVREGER